VDATDIKAKKAIMGTTSIKVIKVVMDLKVIRPSRTIVNLI
jgi:hypothetical protein